MFSIGIFGMNYAQNLTYNIENQTSIAWDFDMSDAGPSAPVNLSLLSGDIATGTITDFAFNLRLRADNNSGCPGTQTVSTTGIGSIPLLCLSSYSINYSVTITSTGYHLHLEISG